MKSKWLKRIGIIAASFTILSICGCNKTPVVSSESVVVSSKEQFSEIPEKESEAIKEEEKSIDLEMEYQFISETKDGLKMGIPQEIKKGGETYVYTGMSDYDVLEEIEVVEKTVEVEVEEQTDLDRSISFKSTKTGNTYVLSADDNYIVWGELVKIPKKVTEVVDWSPRMDKPDIHPMKAVTYFNKYTNQEETVTAKLVRQSASEPTWSKAEEPITGTFAKFEGGSQEYKTTLFVDNKNYVVNVNLENQHPSWEGYQQDILKILGLDGSQYRITGAGWSGKSYWGVEYSPEMGMDMAVEYRDAVYPYEALCRSYHAEYEAEGETLGYKTNVTYFTPVSELTKKKFTKEEIQKDISMIYKIKVKAKYQRK